MFKKPISLLLCISQISMVSISWADQAPAATPVQTPEITLLTSVIGLQGMALPQADLQNKLNAAYTQYSTTAPLEGRQNRLQSALVTMHISTPEQAQAFTTGLQASVQRVATANLTSADQAKTLMTAELQTLAKISPAGAQFSGCDVGMVLGIGGMAVMAGGLVSILVVHGFQSFTSDWTSDTVLVGFGTALIGWFVEQGAC